MDNQPQTPAPLPVQPIHPVTPSPEAPPQQPAPPTANFTPPLSQTSPPPQKKTYLPFIIAGAALFVLLMAAVILLALRTQQNTQTVSTIVDSNTKNAAGAYADREKVTTKCFSVEIPKTRYAEPKFADDPTTNCFLAALTLADDFSDFRVRMIEKPFSEEVADFENVTKGKDFKKRSLQVDGQEALEFIGDDSSGLERVLIISKSPGYAMGSREINTFAIDGYTGEQFQELFNESLKTFRWR